MHSLRSRLAPASLLAFALAAGCGAATEAEGTGGGTGNGPTGLPCDIQALLADRCTSCHSNPPVGGAPSSLVTRADLLAASKTMPGKTAAEAALLRMQSPDAPMPPSPAAPPTADELAAFEAWIAAGMPEGSCEGGGGPFDVPPTCTSGTQWTGGDEGSPMMHPGGACVSCHQKPNAEGEIPPGLVFAGTVYTTGHEPDNCNGGATTPGEAVFVELTGSDGAVVTVPVNLAGNFLLLADEGTVAMPYTARVVRGGEARVMATPQTSGDCNACHTQDGASGAPGRIVLP